MFPNGHVTPSSIKVNINDHLTACVHSQHFYFFNWFTIRNLLQYFSTPPGLAGVHFFLTTAVYFVSLMMEIFSWEWDDIFLTGQGLDYKVISLVYITLRLKMFIWCTVNYFLVCWRKWRILWGLEVLRPVCILISFFAHTSDENLSTHQKHGIVLGHDHDHLSNCTADRSSNKTENVFFLLLNKILFGLKY